MSFAGHQVDEIGTPVRAVIGGGLFAGIDDAGAPCLYAVMGQETSVENGFFLLRIDPDTGYCRRFDAPAWAKGARPCLWSARWQRFFIAAAAGNTEAGGLLQFDPRHACVETLYRFENTTGRFPVGIAEGADGAIYVSSYPDCDVTAYHPGTGQLRPYGSIDAVDQYAYIYCGVDGTVAALIKMSQPHVVVIDPASGARRAVGPVADANAGTGHVQLMQGDNGLLFIDSHDGVFLLTGNSLTPVDTLPPPCPPSSLPGGVTFRYLDGHVENRMQYRTIELQYPDGTLRAISLDYQADGTEIYLTRPGPNGRLYGSSILPLHFFEYNPATGCLLDHGAATTTSGEVYSMDALNGKLYFCSYTHAILSEYDPARPYRFGDPIDCRHPERVSNGTLDPSWPCRFRFGPDDNPCQLGRMDAVAYRPRDMICGPAGKVWVASVPDYGMWGGTLSWYDPHADSFGGAHRGIYADCSPYALTWLPEEELIVVGFSIYGGSGTSPRAERTGFVLWDPERDVEVWRGDVGISIVGVMDLEYAGNGLTYAIIHPNPADTLCARLLLLDLPHEQIVAEERLDTLAGWPLEVSFQRDDRYVYGATREAVYRVPLGTVDLEVLWRDAGDGPTAGGALLAGGYYFATAHRLRRLRL